jgi:hypothetical protein
MEGNSTRIEQREDRISQHEDEMVTKGKNYKIISQTTHYL